MTSADTFRRLPGMPARARFDTARRAADYLTASYTSPPIPVLEIAERNGVNVVFADFKSHSETVAGFCDFAARRLYVNKDDIRTRQMFTMAHELGHWMLHRTEFLEHPEHYPVLPRFQSPETNNAFEQEANAFAAYLLVPSKLLKPVRSSPVSSLAATFGVSRTMMEHRLKND